MMKVSSGLENLFEKGIKRCKLWYTVNVVRKIRQHVNGKWDPYVGNSEEDSILSIFLCYLDEKKIV